MGYGAEYQREDGYESNVKRRRLKLSRKDGESLLRAAERNLLGK